jgi:hypothetical protein
MLRVAEVSMPYAKNLENAALSHLENIQAAALEVLGVRSLFMKLAA